jgi:hypothetical protein
MSNYGTWISSFIATWPVMIGFGLVNYVWEDILAARALRMGGTLAYYFGDGATDAAKFLLWDAKSSMMGMSR